jgi:hypothetical protein
VGILGSGSGTYTLNPNLVLSKKLIFIQGKSIRVEGLLAAT